MEEKTYDALEARCPVAYEAHAAQLVPLFGTLWSTMLLM